MNILLTSGGTRAKIDEVRHIGNMSSGTFGNHIANAALERGCNLTFLYAKGSKAPHEIRIDLKAKDVLTDIESLVKAKRFMDSHNDLYVPIQYDDFAQYHEKLFQLLPSQPDVVILAAAVSDYAPVPQSGKISSERPNLTIDLVQTPKLIRQVRTICPNTFLVGFKLLVGSSVQQLEEAMRKQMEAARCDMVVGNDLRDIKADQHTLRLLTKEGHITIVKNHPGKTLADILVNHILAITGKTNER